jgi:hypothetical protein
MLSAVTTWLRWSSRIWCGHTELAARHGIVTPSRIPSAVFFNINTEKV